jgi:uncharacterized membrane protein
MGYFLKRNIIPVIVAIAIFAFSFIPPLSELSYDNSNMVVNKIEISATLDEFGDMNIVETMTVDFDPGMSAFYRDLVYQKNNANVETNISSFDESSVRVRVFDANNTLLIDTNDGKVNNLVQVGYSFVGDLDAFGNFFNCPGYITSDCISIFTKVFNGTSPTTTFEYSYKIKGVVSVFNDLAELNWIFVDDYGVEVNNINIDLKYPKLFLKVVSVSVNEANEIVVNYQDNSSTILAKISEADLNYEAFIVNEVFNPNGVAPAEYGIYYKLVGTSDNNLTLAITNTVLQANSSLVPELITFGNFSTIIERVSSDQSIITLNRLLPNDILEIRAIFPPDLFTKASSINTIDVEYFNIINEQRNQILLISELLMVLNLLGFALIIGLFITAIFIFRFIYLKYDKEHQPTFSGDYFRDLPANYSPAEMGYLYNFRAISNNDFAATFMDLVRKKYIVINHTGESLTSKNVNYKFELSSDADNSLLKAHESFLLEWFFKIIGNNKSTISIEQIEAYAKNFATAEKYLMDNQKWIRLATQVSTSNDFFDRNVETVGLKYSIYPAIMIILAIILFIAQSSNLEIFMFRSLSPLIGTLIAISIVAISYFVSIKRRSIKGNEDYVRWRGLKKFLTDFSNFKDYPVPSIVVWEHYLVYATSFGIAELVIKQMRLKFSQLNLNENDYYNRSPVMRYPLLWIHMNNRMMNTSNLARTSVAQQQAQKSGTGRRPGGFGGGRSFGGGGGGIRGR